LRIERRQSRIPPQMWTEICGGLIA
jgi:hypothetical protein